MDLREFPREGEEALPDAASLLGWEDSDLSFGSHQDVDLSCGDFPDEVADLAPDESGPLLRCLKRLYRKGKKEKTRRRRTISSVPDLSAMATIWEENEHPGCPEEPELFLASWRSTMDYFSHKKEDGVMKKSFLRFLSILSKTINWNNMTEFFMDNFTSDLVGAVTEMVKKEPPEPTSICLYAMTTIIDLSKRHITKAMGSYKKGILLRTFFKSVFSLSPLKMAPEEGGTDVSSIQYTKGLFIGTYQTFSEMLQQLMLENPVPLELERILQLMVSWLQSSEADQRERAIWSCASLLNFVASKVKLDTTSKFSRLGHLVAVLGTCCGDPVKSISSKAAKSVHLLLSVVLGQKISKLDPKSVHSEIIRRKHKEFLESWNPLVFLKNPSRVAEVFGVYFSPRERTDFILTALDSLTEHCSSISTTEGLLATMVRNCGAEIEKVSDIMDGICSRLDLIRRPSARRLVMKLVGLMASRTQHLDTVISGLLEHSFPPDSNASQLWRSISTEEVVKEQLLENLLARLQRHQSIEQQTTSTSIAITQALYDVISVPDSKEPLQRLYPELLLVLLVELDFSLQTEALPEAGSLQKQCGRGGSLASFAAETLKLLLLHMGCRYEVTFMEKEKGWAMLQNSRDQLEGVTLLARAMLHFACPEITRILDLLFSLLHKGNEKSTATAIAFFVELLHFQEIDHLPEDQIMDSLEEWTRHSSPEVRSLGLRGLGILAIHPDKVEEVKALLPSLLGSLEETDCRVATEGMVALQNLLKFMQRNDIVSLAEKLLPLFNMADAKARTSAVALFAELPNVVKKKEKYLVQEQVSQSLVPLLLHLQDEEPEVVKGCQEALTRCFRFLGWTLPKKVISKKAWHDHPEIAESICRQISWKSKGIPAVLLQCLDHFQCPQVSIRRAAAIFLGCVVQCAEPAVITQEKKDLIFLSLHKLQDDPDPSVRLTAWQATRMVQEACTTLSILPRGQIPLHRMGSQERHGGVSERGHWDLSDPALTHRWNPASPISHRIVPSSTKKRTPGPSRQA
ncbi:maestro heat-like repeat-containing protein family member 7 [Paroedura picta]|uniref:maestro heat-like repeat-containing protein family member 7 n=1 Tax=Paroedura picta TaxID=143630 RepID=UPI00405769FC